ncbi:MAG: hypothetical protein QM490_00255 [Candidatus Gracilibacteria bacterium]
MKNFKKTAIISSIVVTILAINTFMVSAHGNSTFGNVDNNSISTSNEIRGYGMGLGNMRGGFGMGGMMMNGGYMSGEDYKDMYKMRGLMHSNRDLKEDEFNWLIDEQKEYMGFSPLERYDNVNEFNELKSNGFGFGMMR